MRRMIGFVLLAIAQVALAGDGSVRFEFTNTGEGPHGMGPMVVIACSDERFVLDSKAMVDPDMPLRRYWNVTVCRGGTRAGHVCATHADCAAGACELKPTPGGAIIWSTWPVMDFEARCPKAEAKAALKSKRQRGTRTGRTNE